MMTQARPPFPEDPVRVAVVGLGKMGLSHVAMLRATPGVRVTAVCDSSTLLPPLIRKYTDLETYSSYARMLAEADLDAVVIATPSHLHATMVDAALDAGLHVFCEKPFSLDAAQGARLADRAKAFGLVSQVGYHYRFVGSFREVKRLLDHGAIGDVVHILGEAYGPVVLKPQGSTWRTRGAEGGGSLYDYAAHPLNLINWYQGAVNAAGGTVLTSVFSKATDDAVSSTLRLEDGSTAQLTVNWSDGSVRKMSTKITVWGTHGRIEADRQECRAFLCSADNVPAGYQPGWNVRYTTDLTEPVAFYLRGEEYSAQLEAFARRIASGEVTGENDFATAVATDEALRLMRADAARPLTGGGPPTDAVRAPAGTAWHRAKTKTRRIADSQTAQRVRAGGRRLIASLRERKGH